MWVAISFSRRSSRPRDWTWVFCIVGRCFTVWATREVPIMLPRFVIVFLEEASILISWLQSPSAVILEPKNTKSVTVCFVSPSICHEVMGPHAMILDFSILSCKPAFLFSCFTFLKRLFSSSLLSALRVLSSAYLRLLIFLPKILISACASSSPALAWCPLI